MTRTGPQKYPGANLDHWYQDNFGGDDMEVNVVVLHTTEGTTLPDYNGGSVAPNITGVPNFETKTIRWYQHFDVDVSSRALVNKSGGVQTNINNVNQVELVGTCDPSTHAQWQASGRQHIYWPAAPEWAEREVAKYLRWMNQNHNVPLIAAPLWLPYPQSSGATSARFSNEKWNAFKGICGHMHVPENSHGDPGNMNIARILLFAAGGVVQPPANPSPTSEDDVPSMLEESNPTDVELEPGVWTTLAFKGDGILYTGPMKHSTVVTLYFDTATDVETKIQGKFFLTDVTDLKNEHPSDYLVIDHRGGGGHQFVHSQSVPAGKRLWFTVRAVPASAVNTKLLHRAASGPYWAG